ncbi:MAG: hypothetical protein FWG90_01920 [Oscillospiraceae bacterium]|nr:hypothetical protein [Oscillospiraceae bacterium]
MLIYIEDWIKKDGTIGKSKHLRLFFPNTQIECTVEFIDLLNPLFYPFEELTGDERERLNAEAIRKTNTKQYEHWKVILEELQKSIDGMDEIGKLDVMKINGHSMFVPVRD